MDIDMRTGVYLTSGIRKDCPHLKEATSIEYFPFHTLWEKYIPEEQKFKFPQNIWIDIMES